MITGTLSLLATTAVIGVTRAWLTAAIWTAHITGGGK